MIIVGQIVSILYIPEAEPWGGGYTCMVELALLVAMRVEQLSNDFQIIYALATALAKIRRASSLERSRAHLATYRGRIQKIIRGLYVSERQNRTRGAVAPLLRLQSFFHHHQSQGLEGRSVPSFSESFTCNALWLLQSSCRETERGNPTGCVPHILIKNCTIDGSIASFTVASLYHRNWRGKKLCNAISKQHDDAKPPSCHNDQMLWNPSIV